ncbi:MAG: acyl-CoA desaturase [Myxococcaceae bacterium]|nr:acyl-CoA desaturase [Myxococcaceae bacterium]
MSQSKTPTQTGTPADEKIDWIGSIPFFAVHLSVFAAFFTGVSWKAIGLCIALYYGRMILLTIGYHRYFSHRSFKANRFVQFLIAIGATLSAQKGVLWWAANHRHHHRESDTPLDIHSPAQKGFWFSHVGWILCRKYNVTRFEAIRDFARYPELVWLDKYSLLPPTLLGVAIWLFGGWQMLVVGFLWSTVLLWHGTFTINSLSHVYGTRRYKTTDTSRNNWLLALITCGEGWHNNHHYHQNTANQGWFWWEIDISYYCLKVAAWLGIIKDLRLPSHEVKYAFLKYTPEERAELKAGGLVLNPTGKLKEKAEAARARLRDALADGPVAGPTPAPVLKRQ